MKNQTSPTHNMVYWLKKIYLLERMKNSYLRSCDLSSYKKACHLQEKVIQYIHSANFQKKIMKEKTNEAKKLANDIKVQVDVNQVLMDDIKTVTVDYLETKLPSYYDETGSIRNKNATKVFMVDV